MDSPHSSAPTAQDENLEAALKRSIGLPLAALRASLESLNAHLPGNDPLGGVIEEVLRIGTNVSELMEYTCPPEPSPVDCGAAEVVFDALRGIPGEGRSRVTLARIEADGRLFTDPEILARGLRRVVENALEAARDQVLVTVRQQRGATSFCVIDDAIRPFEAEEPAAPFRSTKANRLGLGLTLTERDLALVGGSLRLDRTRLGDTCVLVTVPDRYTGPSPNDPSTPRG